MEIYKDMLEKLKYHRQIIMNSFIKRSYYPSKEEVEAALADVNSRISLFETYISKPGSLFNPAEINHCFEMIYKDIEILYKVLESILMNEYSQLKLHVESTLLELESKADHFSKRCKEEANSSALGTTIVFQTNNWNLSTEDQTTIVDLDEHDFIEGSRIACFANLNDVEKSQVSFKFDAGDSEDTFLALPYNNDDSIYTIPGEMSINKYDFNIDSSAIINGALKLKFEDGINDLNKYKIVGGKGLMSVTYKASGRTDLVRFPDTSSYTYYATEDCCLEFYIVDGDIGDDAYIEYNFNMAPNYQNFSLQDGTIKIDSDIKRVFIDAQAGLLVSFNREHGHVFAECIDPVVIDKYYMAYTGNLKIREMMVREYVRTNLIRYHVYCYINTIEDVSNSIESIYVKEID